MVFVHPFLNGNGRHARLASDTLIRRQGGKPFTWGMTSLNRDGSPREEYLAALREADQGDPERLIRFVRA